MCILQISEKPLAISLLKSSFPLKASLRAGFTHGESVRFQKQKSFQCLGANNFYRSFTNKREYTLRFGSTQNSFSDSSDDFTYFRYHYKIKPQIPL